MTRGDQGRTTPGFFEHRRLEPARVGVVHEHEILSRGIASCLSDDPQVHVAFVIAGGPPPAAVSVIVSSPDGLQTGGYTCPVVLCIPETGPVPGAPVAAVVRWPSVTPEQLVASVRAAAAGFRLELPGPEREAARPFDARAIEVLRLLAEGATTRRISEALFYSERTVKTIIHDLEYELRAATRAQAVAEALRHGLI